MDGVSQTWDTLAGAAKMCRANRTELGSVGTGSLQGHGDGDIRGAQSGAQGAREAPEH